MERRTLVATLAVLAAVAVAVPAVAVAGAGGAADQDNETNDTAAPGERLAGVVGVQGAEVDGELDERSFRVGLNRSAAGASAVVDERLPALEQRVEEIEQRRAALDAARANGSITEGEYRARMATLVAESRNVRRVANVSADAVAAEPGVLDRERNERIRSLRERAGNATGAETAELARSIAGNAVGGGLSDDRPGAADRPGANAPGEADDRQPGDGPPDDDADAPQTTDNETTSGDESTVSTDDEPSAGVDVLTATGATAVPVGTAAVAALAPET